MITCHRKHLEERCQQRGYTLEQVMPCVVRQNGDRWTIDINHEAYPRDPNAPPGLLFDKQALVQQLTSKGGPGTELKKLLAGWPFYFKAEPGCLCNQRALVMDVNGCDWCEQNIDTILRWLREEAERRSLPFLEVGAKLLVRRAISRARAKEKLTDANSPSPAPQPQTSAG